MENNTQNKDLSRNDGNTMLDEVFDWQIKNNGGEEFKFFIDEENRACLNIKFEGELMAGLIMSKKEFEELIATLTAMNKNVSR